MKNSLYGYLLCSNPATAQISTLSLHDALPISLPAGARSAFGGSRNCATWESSNVTHFTRSMSMPWSSARSEEHTSELQSRLHLVCRLLLEKKNNTVCKLA